MFTLFEPRYHTTTPFSAAQVLCAWMAQHSGRAPTWRECDAAQGLARATTYLYWFQASSLSMAVQIAQQVCATGSGVDLRPPASGGPATPMKRCYNAPHCRRLIPDEGRHIRFCATCRRQIASEEVPEPACVGLRGVPIRQYGYGRAGWDDELEEVGG